MKIKLTRSIIVNRQHAQAGAIVETDDRTARELIIAGKAAAVPAAQKSKVKGQRSEKPAAKPAPKKADKKQPPFKSFSAKAD